jgi:hypothetical protein
MAITIRLCCVCGAEMEARRASKKTCGDTCTKRLQRSARRVPTVMPDNNPTLQKENKMTVLKKVTQAEKLAVQETATKLYMGRLEGHDIDISAQPDSRGNYPRRYFRGAIVQFTATGVDECLALVMEKAALGYTLSTIPTQVLGAAHFVHMVKPNAETAIQITEECREAEEKLIRHIEAQNNAIIAKQVAARKTVELHRLALAAKAEDEALDARLLAEVRTALGAK